VYNKNEKMDFEKIVLLNKSPETTKIALNLDRSSIISFFNLDPPSRPMC